MQLFLKILSGMADHVDPDQRSSLIWIGSVCICHFVRHFGVRNFRTFTVFSGVGGGGGGWGEIWLVWSLMVQSTLLRSC